MVDPSHFRSWMRPEHKHTFYSRSWVAFLRLVYTSTLLPLLYIEYRGGGGTLVNNLTSSLKIGNQNLFFVIISNRVSTKQLTLQVVKKKCIVANANLQFLQSSYHNKRPHKIIRLRQSFSHCFLLDFQNNKTHSAWKLLKKVSFNIASEAS